MNPADARQLQTIRANLGIPHSRTKEEPDTEHDLPGSVTAAA
jgi:hypothetical protein